MNDMRQSDLDVFNRLEIKLDTVTEKITCLPCDVNVFQIKLLNRIVYGGIGLVLTCFLVAVISLVIVQGPKPVKADIKHISILKEIQIGHEPYIKSK